MSTVKINPLFVSKLCCLTFGTLLKTRISFPMEKEQFFLADRVKNYAFNK